MTTYANTDQLHKLRTLHLFAGAGGGLLGDLLLGHQPVCAVEINPYCQQVLHARQKDGVLPWFPIFGDVKAFDGKPWRGLADVVSGGFPCVDISVAGKGAGIDGERSGLWGEMARIVCEVQPRYVFVENSPALATRGLGRVLGDLAAMGFNAKWGVLGAKAAGGCHERERIWVFAFHSHRNGQQAKEPRFTLLEEKTRLAGYARHIAGTTGMDGLHGFVKAGTCGKNDALAGDLDRFKAVGNGQVPAVVALAWHTLSKGII